MIAWYLEARTNTLPMPHVDVVGKTNFVTPVRGRERGICAIELRLAVSASALSSIFISRIARMVLPDIAASATWWRLMSLV